MAKLTKCIYCGRPAGSREHTLPASLGGRRKHKGVLCKPIEGSEVKSCNEKFSPLDADLAKQLDDLNAFLGVVGDHADAPKLATAHDPSSGAAYAIDERGYPKLAAPVPVAGDDPNGTRRFMFSDEAQVRAFIEEQKAKGIEVKIVGERERGQRFFADHLELPQWTFGGRRVLREVGRIALNFLAESFPDVAQFGELVPFKAFVTTDDETVTGNEPVWWDLEYRGQGLPRCEYDFAHRITLVVDAVRRRAWARVSFFESLGFVVDFGPTTRVSETKALVVDINPCAPHAAPDVDRQVRVVDPAPDLPPRPSTRTVGDFQEFVQPAMNRFLEKVAAEQWRKIAEELLPPLNELRTLPRADRVARLREVLSGHRQGTLNFASSVLDRFRQYLESENLESGSDTVDLGRRVAELVAGDPSSPSGLTPVAMAFLDEVHGRVLTGLEALLDAGPLTVEGLRTWVRGAEAERVIQEIVQSRLRPPS